MKGRAANVSRSFRDWFAQSGERLDDAIAIFAPSYGGKRKAVRKLWRARNAAISAIGNTTSDRTVDGKWLGSRLSPDSDLELHLDKLRRDSQELYGQFGIAQGAVEGRVDNVVGPGIPLRAAIKPTGNITKAQAEIFNAELDAIFDRLAPHVGPSGRDSFAEVQRLAERCWRRDGEAFIVISDVMRPDKPIPLQVQVIAAERVETPPDKQGDPLIRLGIEKNEAGDIVAYHVRHSHPDDTKNNSLNYKRLPAWRVCHLYEKLWPDQSRGLPWFAAILKEVKDFGDYKDAVIVAAQVAAAVTLIIGTDNPAEMAANSQNSQGLQELEAGSVLYRSNEDEIHTLNPNQPTTSFGSYAEFSYLSMSAGLNWPFGWLTKDRRRATYSAGKLEEIEGGVAVRVDQTILCSRFGCPFWYRLVDESVITGATSIDPTDYHRRPWEYQRHRAKLPGRPWIDPSKEVPAAVLAKNENLAPLAEIHAKTGLSTDDVFDDREAERREEERRGIVPPAVVAQLAAAEAMKQNAAAGTAGDAAGGDPPPPPISPAGEEFDDEEFDEEAD